MKRIDLKGDLREEVGKKSSKQLRKQELVPCVVYGIQDPVHFVLPEKEFGKLVYTPNIYLISLKIGEKALLCTLKEVQFHPVSDKPIHADFYEVTEDAPITVQVPVVLEGFAAGVQEGGKLKLESRRLTVQGLIKDIPDEIKIDVTNLTLGQRYKVRELTIDNLEMMDPEGTVIASVLLTRVAKGMAIAEDELEEETEGEEGAEGEEGVEGGEDAPAAEE